MPHRQDRWPASQRAIIVQGPRKEFVNGGWGGGGGMLNVIFQKDSLLYRTCIIHYIGNVSNLPQKECVCVWGGGGGGRGTSMQ